MAEIISLMTGKKKASYAIGVQTALQLKGQFAEMDADALFDGMKDAFGGTSLQLPVEEINEILANLKKELEVQHKQWVATLSQNNKKAGEVFLLENKKKEGVVTLESGLQYQVLSSGDKSNPRPTLLDTVQVHYRGNFIDERVFDSSYQRGEPALFPLSRVIPGWSEVLQLMRVGDKWKVFIPSYLAYGEVGFGPQIEPNMTLIFEMELLAIQ